MSTPWAIMGFVVGIYNNIDFTLVFFFGCAVGAAELVSRHSDHRWGALTTAPSLAYLALNGLLSTAALVAIHYVKPSWLGYGVGPGGAETTPDLIWLVLTAGFGAAAFFRSAIFKLKTSDGEIAVGPAIVFDIFLNVIDEAVDRVIGVQRVHDASQIMSGVDFSKACKDLPTLSFASLRRLSPEAQRQFAVQLDQLIKNDARLDDKTRVLSLSLSIMTVTGKSILEKCVAELGDSIKSSHPRS